MLEEDLLNNVYHTSHMVPKITSCNFETSAAKKNKTSSNSSGIQT